MVDEEETNLEGGLVDELMRITFGEESFHLY